MAVTFIQDYSFMRKKKVCPFSRKISHSLADLSIDVDGIWSASKACWFVEVQADFVSHNKNARERTALV